MLFCSDSNKSLVTQKTYTPLKVIFFFSSAIILWGFLTDATSLFGEQTFGNTTL